MTDFRRMQNPTRALGTRWLVIFVGVVALACADKAKPAYEQCVKLEAEYETVKARDACQAAVKADPKSKSGQAAANKLVELNLEADKILQKDRELMAPCPSGKWVTRCKWKGEPRPNLLEADSRAKCNIEANQLKVVDVVCPDCVCKDRFVEPYDEEGREK